MNDDDRDDDQRCPECDRGFVVVGSYDPVNNWTDAWCSRHCGWTA